MFEINFQAMFCNTILKGYCVARALVSDPHSKLICFSSAVAKAACGNINDTRQYSWRPVLSVAIFSSLFTTSTI